MLSKPCSWTSGLPLARRGQSPQEKRQVHGTHWDDKSCMNCHDDGHNNVAAIVSSYYMSGYLNVITNIYNSSPRWIFSIYQIVIAINPKRGA